MIRFILLVLTIFISLSYCIVTQDKITPTMYQSVHGCKYIELPSGTITSCDNIPDKYHVVWVAQ